MAELISLDEHGAIERMFLEFQALKRAGWQDGIYVPKDGTRFECVEAGSTGIHVGLWMTFGCASKTCGCVFVESGNDLWPSHPILWRPLTKAPR